MEAEAILLRSPFGNTTGLYSVTSSGGLQDMDDDDDDDDDNDGS
jgi:hypothetical protein